MKKLISLTLAVVLALTFAGCGYEYAELDLVGEYTRDYAGTDLNVYNWGEYICDGTDGSVDVIKEFEKITGINVNYTTFDSNETMYSQLKTVA